MTGTIKLPFGINRIYFIIGLTGSHKQSAEDLYMYTISSLFPSIVKPIIYVKSRTDLINVLKTIAQEVSRNDFPLIHIETHGLKSGMGIVLPNTDEILWHDLRPFFRQINKLCCNNLTLCLAACKTAFISIDLVESFYESLDSITPFFCFVGADSEISVDDLILSFPHFYNKLNESKSWDDAVSHMNTQSQTKLSSFSCHQITLMVLHKFLNTWIKERYQLIQEDPNRILVFYCNIYQYTYNKACTIESIETIFQSEQFYIDFLNKRIKDFLLENICPESAGRFPPISKINNFHTAELKIVRRQ